MTDGEKQADATPDPSLTERSATDPGLSQNPEAGKHTQGLSEESRPRPGEPDPTIQYSLQSPAQPGATVSFDGSRQQAEPVSVAVSTAGARATELPKMPNYDLLEVLGRGAMGVVYKARQRGLKRIVALKMILAGGHASEADLARFTTEAEAAAQLQHPNIVQVYEVGEHDGCPYLSLEYVNGGSLKDKTAGQPQPVRHAAQLMQVLAQAMDYAHRHAIVHRDLKPANVMLTTLHRGDGGESSISATPLVEEIYGIPKIADFGLAKRLEEDTGQTRTGTILGTPMYMAPEQAEGRSKEVGPHSDQYALGAMLYELLTGRQPFRGANVWDTLEQVRTLEPVPPSRLQPKVTPDLDTICLKCLQKDPGKRYANTAALAEDLRRFVAGEPILARPISTAERFARWCKRNPRVAMLTSAVFALLVTTVISLTVFSIRLTKEQTETAKQRDLAEENARLEEVARKLADKKTEEAERAQKVASEQRGLALDALGKLVSNVQVKLQDTAEHALRQQLLEIGMEGLKKVADSADNNQSATLKDRTMMAGHFQMAQIFGRLGKTEESLHQYERCQVILQALQQAEPQSAKLKGNLAVVHVMLGDTKLRMQGEAAAREEYRKALKLREELVAYPQPGGEINPTNAKLALADSYEKLGTIAASPQEAQDYYVKALGVREQLFRENPTSADAKYALALLHIWLGNASFRLGDIQRARGYFEKSLTMREELLEADPKSLLRKRDLAFVHEQLGELHLQAGPLDRARDEYTKAMGLYQELLQTDPQAVLHQDDLGRAYYGLAATELRLGLAEPAKKHFGESLKLVETRAHNDPKDLSVQKALMVNLARCGQHERAAPIAETIRKLAPDDEAAFFHIACCYALCSSAVANGKPPAKLTPAEMQMQKGYTAKAIAALHEALSHGYKDLTGLQMDPDLDPIRDQPEFVALIQELKKVSTQAKRP